MLLRAELVAVTQFLGLARDSSRWLTIGFEAFLLRRMSEQHKTRVSLVIGLDQTSHDTS